MKVELISEQKIALEKLKRQNRDHYVRDRIRCVLLASEGWSTKLIVQSQRIHETTVQRYLYPLSMKMLNFLSNEDHYSNYEELN